MDCIAETDWGFEDIRANDEARAARLESAGSPDELVVTLTRALSEAFGRSEIRFAIDSRDNRFVERRAILQFRVAPEDYDWFFNARTGYRAQFWRCPSLGID
jgi:hypothetical protein